MTANCTKKLWNLKVIPKSAALHVGNIPNQSMHSNHIGLHTGSAFLTFLAVCQTCPQTGNFLDLKQLVSHGNEGWGGGPSIRRVSTWWDVLTLSGLDGQGW